MVRGVDLGFVDRPGSVVVVIEAVVGAEPDILRRGVFQDAEDRFTRQPIAVPLFEIDVTLPSAGCSR